MKGSRSAKAEAAVQSGPKDCPVMALALDGISPISVVDVTAPHTIVAKDSLVPCVFNFTNDGGFLHKNSDATLDAFATKFRSSQFYTQLGRASEMIKSDLSQKFVCPIVVESDKIRRHLTQADLSYLDATWTWGCLPSCQAIGAERLSLASFNVQTSGTRRVLLADVEGVYNFVKKGAAHGS